MSGSRKQVLVWNGDADEYLNYRFEQKLFVKGIKNSDRYTCGPLLVRALGSRPKAILKKWDGLDCIDEVDNNATCIGVGKTYVQLENKLNLRSVSEVGSMVEKLLKRFRRHNHEEMSDYITRFENALKELMPLTPGATRRTTGAQRR